MYKKALEKLNILFKDGALHIVIGSFVTKFVAFFGSIVVVRLLTKNDYGVLSYVENLYSYAFIVAGYGLMNAMLRYIIIADDNKKRAYFDRIVKNSFVFDIILAIIALLINEFVSYPSEFKQAKGLLPFLAVLIPFQDMVNILLSYLRSVFRNKLYAYSAIVSSTILILGRIVGALVLEVKGVIISRLVLNFVFATAGLALIRYYFVKMQPKEVLTKAEKKEMDIYSMQYMLTNGLWAVFMLNDLFLLGQLTGSSSILADYKVACVLPGNISIFSTAIGTYIGPKFTKNERNIFWIRTSFKKALLFTIAIMLCVCSLIWALANPLIRLLYGSQYLTTISVMRILLFGAFLNSGLRYTIANILAAMGEIKYNMIISIIGVITQVLLDIFLIPQMGMYGAATANCIAYGVMSLYLLFIFCRLYFKKACI